MILLHWREPWLHLVCVTGLCSCSHKLLVDFLSDDSWAQRMYEYSRILLEITSLTFFSPVMFGSTLSLWAIQLPVPGHPGTVVLGMGSILRLGSQLRPVIGLATPTTLSHHCPSTSYRQDRCGSKVLWLDWCPRPSAGNLFWLQMVEGHVLCGQEEMRDGKIKDAFGGGIWEVERSGL